MCTAGERRNIYRKGKHCLTNGLKGSILLSNEHERPTIDTNPSATVEIKLIQIV